MISDLMCLLKTNEIDLIILNNVPPLLSHRVISRGLLVYSKNDLAKNIFTVETIKHYIDTKPLRQVQNKYFKESILQC